MAYRRIYILPSLERRLVRRAGSERVLGHTWPQRTVRFQMLFQFLQRVELCFASATVALHDAFGAQASIDLLLLLGQERIRGEFNMLDERGAKMSMLD